MMGVRVKNMDNGSSVEVEKASLRFLFFYSQVLQFVIKNQNTLFLRVPPVLSSYLLINLLLMEVRETGKKKRAGA